MKKIAMIAGAALSVLVFVQCETKQDPFAISESQVGLLTKDTQIKQLDSILTMDSIVKLSSIKNVLGTQGEVEVYEKGGEKLLLVSPHDETDPNSTIENIQFFDARFKTAKGLSINSTFKDIKDNYTIENIQTTFNSVVIFLKDSNLFITIDKKQLSENARYDPSLKIEASHIPDTATFKYVMIGWDKEEDKQ
ncbi:hypothetical protein SCB49_09775 [unidentified eubacterium SCB49]|nr:hypothetical protein SCB49_09775 [unidentified eubacterium SCB49]